MSGDRRSTAAAADSPRPPGTVAPDSARAPATAHFTAQVLDESPELLTASYGLRYQVYCLERQFLPEDKYPDKLEIDAYDAHALHLGVLNASNEMVATARLVRWTRYGLPLLAHCTTYPDQPALRNPSNRIVEVSRLSVSRRYNRRAGDENFALQGVTRRADGPERRGGGEIVMVLYKALYQASKRHGFTHWIVATERSLQRLVARYGFPFHAIGPETDYYGPVAPYLMDLAEFDAVILSGRFPLLESFLDRLEPEFRPTRADLPLQSAHA
jgi:N-acyl amino acid synthase of PEP-CTERM/exosortase system